MTPPASAARVAPAARPPSVWTLSRPARIGLYALYACALLLFCRCLLLNNVQYLDLDRYIAGSERLPYQRRVLPMLMLRACLKIPLPQALTGNRHGIFAHPAEIYIFAFNLLSLTVATWLAIKLYRLASPNGRFAWLILPLLLYVASWTYLLHPEANLAFPYDLPSLTFFTAGIYFIYTRRFWPLALTLLIGSFNRETTLFLIPLFLLDSIAGSAFRQRRPRLALGTIPWARLVLLSALWLAVKFYLGTLYLHNDASEQFLRLHYNLRFLLPDHWPQDLGACGYLLPVVFLLRRRIPDRRIALYLWIIPAWFALMLVYGIIEETRVYGELCVLVTLSSLLLLDAYSGTERGKITDDFPPSSAYNRTSQIPAEPLLHP